MKPKPDNRNMKAESFRNDTKKTEGNIRRSNNMKSQVSNQMANSNNIEIK